ncbi:hypothetical protein [Mangrovicoccus sp. HB161399]|uniref:hypothetical protein n=1 Tax=Mangrovicoccus sp. HB161399 TaxID=2720392 RepID=UPI001556940A|nr:hypothetical protein [Mangrovicoccus sp. HB161399]
MEFARYTGPFWLWILGAYEVLRTIDRNGECLSRDLRQKIAEEKRHVAQIRMPFAKQELNRRSGPAFGELSVVGPDGGPGCDIGGERFRAAGVIARFAGLIASVKPEDVPKEIPTRRPEHPV